MNWLICVAALVAAFCSHSEARARCTPPIPRENGYVHGDWGNLQEGSTLVLKCNRGYKLKGKEQVFCYSGRWSGTLGTCEARARCKFPEQRKNGRLLTYSASQEDGSGIWLECDEGHKMKGAGHAVCRDGKWSATLGTCEVVTCQPPRTSCLAIAHPPNCFRGPSPYDAYCRILCPPGYRGAGGLYCSKDGKWMGRNVECKDVEPPVIECPQPYKITELKTDPGKATTEILLPTPRYSDNSQEHGGKLHFSAILDGQSISVEEEHRLGIIRKEHEVNYLVKDEAGHQVVCRFYYRVVDDEPPKIKNCPEDIVMTTRMGENRVRVFWKEPQVTDNAGDDSVEFFCSRPNGGIFFTGKSFIVCTATDQRLNQAFCKFRVTVKIPCFDQSNFIAALPMAALLPGVTIPDPSNPCSVFAANPQMCNQIIAPGVPDDFVWKNICRKTCKAC
ncbi:sushi, von Willebrand factor type A, EGF and pentraxin domain-containing protein 1-like [Dendronephthya gigantea]|uniref:sushi, von Willebrand factor type A, EGF and pentraxin domain-containing protein 1-like n=1 Tax=Dendronephthya gigantea TaxID=151771 RepID=UPI00106CC867|nr:sushi, von Willebrand factor type A, EGF and pentraxin domain-containing protein 1-like [Dendronephthya gigantea]